MHKLLTSDKNLMVGYKEYLSVFSGFGRMDLEFRRTSRRQTSQLPRWCDIPAAWASKSTPFFLRFLEPASKSIRFLEHPLARASAAAVELSADICYHSHTSSIEVWEC